jgi:hypothetical protein
VGGCVGRPKGLPHSARAEANFVRIDNVPASYNESQISAMCNRYAKSGPILAVRRQPGAVVAFVQFSTASDANLALAALPQLAKPAGLRVSLSAH